MHWVHNQRHSAYYRKPNYARDNALVMGRVSWSGGGNLEVVASTDKEWRSCHSLTWVPSTVHTNVGQQEWSHGAGWTWTVTAQPPHLEFTPRLQTTVGLEVV